MYKIIEPPEPVFTYGMHLDIKEGEKLYKWFSENRIIRIKMIQEEIGVNSSFSMRSSQLVAIEDCLKENLKFQKLRKEEIELWAKYKSVIYAENKLRLSDKCKSICFDLGVWVGEYFKLQLETDWQVHKKKTIDFNAIVLPSNKNNMVFNPLTVFEVIALRMSRNYPIDLKTILERNLNNLNKIVT